MNRFSILLLILCINLSVKKTVFAQDTSFQSQHAAILFPYPMYQEKWRSSIGFTMLTSPEDITEELRIRIPCGDYHLLRKINQHFILDNRLLFQVLQNHLTTGIRYIKPLNDHWFASIGADISYWFGFVKVTGFNSSASGWQSNTNLSLGYKTRKNLLFTFKFESGYNLSYRSVNGENKYNSSQKYYNGEVFTFAIEQPFYNKKHITLAFSAINQYFNWQTWALFYKNDRKVFYPQMTVGFIL